MNIASRWVAGAIVAMAVGLFGVKDCHATEPRGIWEAGLFIPYMNFDTDAPIEDSAGQDDEIRSAFGHGLSFAYRFSNHHALEAEGAWVSSDSEDMGGKNHFAIRTRYTTLAYRGEMKIGSRLALFGTLGIGWFYARAMETDHPNYGGWAILEGGGLRFYTGQLASVRVYVQHMRIRLDPDDADNLMVAVGGAWHFGTR